MKDRLKELRNALGLNQKDFAKSISLGQSTWAMIEVGKRELIDRHIQLICSTFNVNEKWLRTGEGEMFKELTGNDEIATYVYGLLQDGDSPLNSLIIEIMRTYYELDPKSQKVIDNTIATLISNIQNKKRD